MKAKYLNPFTDFGFKKIFGEEASKPLLIDFLNAILPQNDRIVTLTFKNIEQLGQTSHDRKAIYDIYCENELGEKFIVELQKAKQNYFKERTIYYSTFPIREQAEKGEWNYNLKAVYCIGILDFTLEDFQSIPGIFSEEVFNQAFEKAEIAKFDQTDLANYENSLKIYRDLKGVIDTAFDEGKLEGKLEEKNEMARVMKFAGEPIEKIIKYTGLAKDEIEKL